MSGILMLEVLCQPAFAGDYAGLRDAVVQETTRTGTSTAIFMGLMAGGCVGFSNFMLAASMPMAGLTRSLPVFNGAAVVTGVSLNYALEGNPHPETLVIGVVLILVAIILTFVSRNAPDAPCAPRGLAKEALGSVHILSYTNLTTLAPQNISERGMEELPLNSDPGSSSEDLEECVKCIPGGPVVQGLILCAISGSIDGCWSVFATGASMRGLDHYVACFYMCLGFLVPLFTCELLLFCSNPAKFIAECRRLTLGSFLMTALCGFLNIFGIITYYAATSTISATVAFAIFLCTPLVSISIGVRCFRELNDEPRAKHVLVFTILALYVVAILVISANALISGTDD
uniref:EamA domain-containing protein n=1 Tax=Florenciella parvula TaxID=236787 RepID=A0A7S2FJ68_9STRA